MIFNGYRFFLAIHKFNRIAQLTIQGFYRKVRGLLSQLTPKHMNFVIFPKSLVTPISRPIFTLTRLNPTTLFKLKVRKVSLGLNSVSNFISLRLTFQKYSFLSIRYVSIQSSIAFSSGFCIRSVLK